MNHPDDCVLMRFGLLWGDITLREGAIYAESGGCCVINSMGTQRTSSFLPAVQSDNIIWHMVKLARGGHINIKLFGRVPLLPASTTGSSFPTTLSGAPDPIYAPMVLGSVVD